MKRAAAKAEAAKANKANAGDQLMSAAGLRDKNDAVAKGLCFDFQKGKCAKSANDCNYKHELAKLETSRGRSRTPDGAKGKVREVRT